MKQITKITEKINVQRRCEEIHAQYGTSEMANYRILLMYDKIENYAFEAGRNSMIDNIPNLEWVEEEYGELISYGFQGRYIIDRRNFLYFDTNMCCIASGYDFSKKCNSLDEAKQAANEDYKNRMKKNIRTYDNGKEIQTIGR